MANNKKSSCSWIIVVIIIAIVFTIIVTKEDEQQAPSDTLHETEAETEATEVDLLPSVPDDLKDHPLFEYRGKATCETLTGKYLATVVFVNEPGCMWDEASMNNVKTKQGEATSKLLSEAASYGAHLEFSMVYMTATVDEAVSMQTYSSWASKAAISAGFTSLKTAGVDIEKQYGADGAPIFFYVNRPGRSFASVGYYEDDTEYAIFYQDAEDYRHELNHLCGAKDYYYPDSFENIAKVYYPNSIMITTGTTDSFTAYLMGWTDTLTATDLEFLSKVSEIPTTDFTNPTKNETFTGFVLDYDYGDGATYTGDLIDGVPYGNGKLVYADGASYDGGWVYGHFEGTGTYTYADGGSYTGEWTDGAMTGYGTFKWTNGDSYTGYFLNGTMHGQGTYTGADGSVISGTWDNGNFIG